MTSSTGDKIRQKDKSYVQIYLKYLFYKNVRVNTAIY